MAIENCEEMIKQNHHLVLVGDPVRSASLIKKWSGLIPKSSTSGIEWYSNPVNSMYWMRNTIDFSCFHPVILTLSETRILTWNSDQAASFLAWLYLTNRKSKHSWIVFCAGNPERVPPVVLGWPQIMLFTGEELFRQNEMKFPLLEKKLIILEEDQGLTPKEGMICR